MLDTHSNGWKPHLFITISLFSVRHTSSEHRRHHNELINEFTSHKMGANIDEPMRQTRSEGEAPDKRAQRPLGMTESQDASRVSHRGSNEEIDVRL